MESNSKMLRYCWDRKLDAVPVVIVSALVIVMVKVAVVVIVGALLE